MQTFIKSSYINCDVKSLFDFHIDTNNLQKITPNDTKVELLTKDFKPIVSQILKIKATKYFIPMNWEVKIEKIDGPNLLVDLALKSPFAFWEHKHIFIKHGNMSELKDVVTFKMPFGFIGKLLEVFVIKDLQKMFDFRHKITKEILEKEKF
ncbi:MAG: SRPBCC family protein [Aliarcobacter sp.]|nr:SRPBCC family protein [Aliarcobacter sp.]